MCGRLSWLSETPLDQLDPAVGATWASDDDRERSMEPRWNIGPMQRHPILRLVAARPVLARARWGVERVIGKKPDGSMKMATPFNTVSETAMAKPSWRKSLTERRCIVPATGFYEWTGPKSDRRPIHFTRRDGKPLLLAGVFDEAKGDDRPLAFSVLTTTPNATLELIHDRMPVILDVEQALAWLDAPHPDLMRPAGDDVLVGAPASKRVNSVGNEGPELLLPDAELT